MPKFSNSVSYVGRKASTDHSGEAKFATAAQAAAATADDLIISPSTLDSALDTLLPIITSTTLAGATNTNIPSTLAAKTYIDNVAISGAPDASTTVKGIVEEGTDAEVLAGTTSGGTGARLFVNPGSLSPLFASPPAIGGTAAAAGSFTTLAASGLSSLSGSATILTGGTALNLGSDNSADAVNLGVGTTARAIGIGNSAAAHVVTIGSTTGAAQVVLNSGTAGIQMASTGSGDITIDSDDTLLLDADGVLELNSSAGAIGIGNDADAFAINLGTGAAARTITLGNSTGATSLVFNCGTGALNIGTNAIAHTVTIGNVTGATAIALNVGTGNFALNGVGASTYTVGAATTTGTITLGGTAQTGTMTLGSSSGTNIVSIGAGEGATTVNIAGGATNAKAVNIATGAVANVVTIGSTSGAAQLDLLCGTGDFSLDGAATSDLIVGASLTSGVITVGGTAQTGTMTLGDSSGTNIVAIGAGEGATTVNIAGGATNAKAVNIATGAVASTVAIGSASAGAITVDTAASVSIDAAASSNFSVSGAGVDLDFASAGGRIIVTSGEDAADSIYLHADAGTGEKIRIHSDQGTGADSVELESDVGGITLTSGLASADAINLSASAGGVDVDGALQVNIASSQAATGALTLAVSNAAANITMTGAVAFTPDSITSDNAGVAASINTVVTMITTDGDSNEDNVTLADGLLAGQIKVFSVIAAGNAADSIKITPANFSQGTKITFAADPTGKGCQMLWDGTNWNVISNNGGTIA